MRVETHHGPLAELAFVRADTIDAALSTYGLATVADLDRVFRQVHRVLRTDRPFVFSLPHPAFVMLDPAGGEPVLRRAWWDTSPVTWSAGAPATSPTGAITLGMLFSALGRAGFAVDTVLEPPADRGRRRRRLVRRHALGAPHPRGAGAQARHLSAREKFPRSRVTIRPSRRPDR